jgi:ribosomal subunit interface protein
MRIRVNGKQIDVGDALTTHCQDRVGDVVNKYAEKPVEANITFSKDRHEFVSDISVHLSTGLTTQAHGKSSDVYDALEKALERMEKQLRRYKRRLKDHHKERKNPVETFDVPAYILASDGGESETAEPSSLQPVIVAEMETPVKSLSVGEAVMQMELNAAPLLVFRNTTHGGVNVVYQREDGNVGWIDPRSTN